MIVTEDLEALLERLRADEFYAGLRIAEDGSRIVGVLRLLYTWAIVAGLDNAGYEDRWCYEDLTGVVAGLNEWTGNAGTEPEGWFRNPRTGRRRPGGDATREHVER